MPKQTPSSGSLQDALSALRKDGLQVGNYSEFDNFKVEGLPTGNLTIDNLTGIGGFPSGRITELVGPPSSGKTTAALQAAARVQEAGGVVMFLDFEKALDPAYAVALGLDVHADSFVYMRPDSFEDGANAFRTFQESSGGAVRLVIHDSVAAMTTKHELAALTGAVQVADRAKGQPLTAQILTPSGWTVLGDIRQGDQVLTGSGVAGAVVEVVPHQGVHPVYRVTCSDGTSTEAAGDHGWLVDFATQRNHGLRGQLVTTDEIRAMLATDKRWQRAYLPPVEAEFASQEHLIAPYVLGSLIGDGSLPEKSAPVLCGHAGDRDEQVKYLLSDLPEWVKLVEFDSGNPNVFTVRLVDSEWSPGWMRRSRIKTELRRLGLLGSRDRSKSIPPEYLHDSYDNRLSLLRGLLDTDGTVRRDTGSAVFATVSGTLARQVQELVIGIGGDASVCERPSIISGRATGQTAYKVSVRNLGDSPFRLQRKADLWRPAIHRTRPRRIVSVEYLRDAEVRCIRIDRPDHLYVTDGMIPLRASKS